jgi:uncharacterized protein
MTALDRAGRCQCAPISGVTNVTSMRYSRTMTAKCPICRKSQERAFAPFCSKRCADVDLNRWLSESYVLPVRDEGDPEAPTPRQSGDNPTERD